MKIILDFHLTEQLEQSDYYIKKMFDELKSIDNKKYEIIASFNLGSIFQLKKHAFEFAYNYGQSLGYKVTSCIYTIESLKYLLTNFTNIDFIMVKTNIKNADGLIKSIPENINLFIISDVPPYYERKKNTYKHLWTVFKSPAYFDSYINFRLDNKCCIYDNTEGFALFYRFQPEIICFKYQLDKTYNKNEVHIKTPSQLKKIL